MKKEKQKWLVLEDDDCIHVIPDSDIKPHGYPKGKKIAPLSNTDCPCKPKVDFGGRKPMVVHNSFEQGDGDSYRRRMYRQIYENEDHQENNGVAGDNDH